MALVAQQITVSVIVTDKDGSASLTRARLPVGTSILAAQAAAEALIGVLRPLSDGKIARYSVSYQLRESSTIIPRSALPTPTLALFTFEHSSDPNQFASMTIPLDPSWLVASGPLAGFAVDLTHSEVLAFTDEMTNGIWVDRLGDDLGAVVNGFRTGA